MCAFGPKFSQSQEGSDPEPVNRLRIPVVPVVEDDDGEAILCNVPGTADINCDSVLCPVPAEVAAAWPTAADWADSPAGSVVCWGAANGVSRLVTADDPA